jgi:hypothetical protein
VAYVLSFVTKPLPVIAAGLSSAVRWTIAAGAVLGAAWLYRRDRAWRLMACLAVMLAAAVAPWIARVYLTPPGVQFDLSYLIGGRVSYWSFAVVALGLGLAGERIAGEGRGRLVLAALGLLAYANALRIYEPADFQAMALVQSRGAPAPAPWLPFSGPQPAWPLALAVALAVAFWLALRTARARG